MGYGAEAVVLREGVLVEQHPLRKTQFWALGSVARERMDLCHMLMCQNEVVPGSIHIPGHLRDVKARHSQTGLQSPPKSNK